MEEVQLELCLGEGPEEAESMITAKGPPNHLPDVWKSVAHDHAFGDTWFVGPIGDMRKGQSERVEGRGKDKMKNHRDRNNIDQTENLSHIRPELELGMEVELGMDSEDTRISSTLVDTEILALAAQVEQNPLVSQTLKQTDILCSQMNEREAEGPKQFQRRPARMGVPSQTVTKHGVHLGKENESRSTDTGTEPGVVNQKGDKATQKTEGERASDPGKQVQQLSQENKKCVIIMSRLRNRSKGGAASQQGEGEAVVGDVRSPGGGNASAGSDHMGEPSADWLEPLELDDNGDVVPAEGFVMKLKVKTTCPPANHGSAEPPGRPCGDASTSPLLKLSQCSTQTQPSIPHRSRKRLKSESKQQNDAQNVRKRRWQKRSSARLATKPIPEIVTKDSAPCSESPEAKPAPSLCNTCGNSLPELRDGQKDICPTCTLAGDKQKAVIVVKKVGKEKWKLQKESEVSQHDESIATKRVGKDKWKLQKESEVSQHDESIATKRAKFKKKEIKKEEGKRQYSKQAMFNEEEIKEGANCQVWFPEVSSSRRPRRNLGCKKCEACLRKDCGKCDHCKDKSKFGGLNTKRQKCRLRICQVNKTKMLWASDQKLRRQGHWRLRMDLPDTTSTTSNKEELMILRKRSKRSLKGKKILKEEHQDDDDEEDGGGGDDGDDDEAWTPQKEKKEVSPYVSVNQEPEPMTTDPFIQGCHQGNAGPIQIVRLISDPVQQTQAVNEAVIYTASGMQLGYIPTLAPLSLPPLFSPLSSPLISLIPLLQPKEEDVSGEEGVQIGRGKKGRLYYEVEVELSDVNSEEEEEEPPHGDITEVIGRVTQKDIPYDPPEYISLTPWDFSLLEDTGEDGGLGQLLRALRQTILPAHWVGVLAAGPRLQLLQTSKLSTMADTLVHIHPGFTFHICVQGHALLPTHTLYHTHPERFNSVTQVVSLLLDLECLSICQGVSIPSSLSWQPDQPIMVIRAATCHLLVPPTLERCQACQEVEEDGEEEEEEDEEEMDERTR